MLIAGITGGIGSGKSTVANIFIKLGTPVFFSDIEAAKIISGNDFINKKIISEFGKEILFKGKIDRKKLAKIVFTDKEKLARLNSIIHPAVRSEFSKWAAKQKGAPFVMQEAAILFETGAYKNLDYILLVTAPKSIRIQRVMKRDNVSENEIVARMKNQWSDYKKKKLADAVIINDGRKRLLPPILKIHRLLVKRFS